MEQYGYSMTRTRKHRRCMLAAHRSTTEEVMPWNVLRSNRLGSKLLLLLLLVLPACFDPAPPASSESSQALDFCQDNCDCPFASYCANHTCVGDFGPFAPCYCAARDCGSGQVCNLGGQTGGGFCSSSCDSDCDCEYGNVCRSGQCQADFGPWAPCYCGARDCATPGQHCSNGGCTF